MDPPQLTQSHSYSLESGHNDILKKSHIKNHWNLLELDLSLFVSVFLIRDGCQNSFFLPPICVKRLHQAPCSHKTVITQLLACVKQSSPSSLPMYKLLSPNPSLMWESSLSWLYYSLASLLPPPSLAPPALLLPPRLPPVACLPPPGPAPSCCPLVLPPARRGREHFGRPARANLSTNGSRATRANVEVAWLWDTSKNVSSTFTKSKTPHTGDTESLDRCG